MGFWNDIYRGVMADVLEKTDCDRAVQHVLKSGFESWENNRRAGDILKGAGRYRDAIRYYREAIRERRGGIFGTFEVGESIEECYEALGEYSELMEVYFEEEGPRQNFGGIYQQYKKYRTKSPSLKLSHSRLKEMYTGLCRHWKYNPSEFYPRPENERAEVIDEMEKEGLFDEAIEVLKTDPYDTFESASPKQKHFKVADLYEKKRDFKNAVRLYEDYNLLGNAATCYERAGRIDKAILYLLGEGNIKEAAALYERVGRPANIDRLISLSGFTLLTFDHPVARSERLSASMRSRILYTVGDNFQYILESIRADKKDSLKGYEWAMKRFVGADGRRLDDSDGEFVAVQYLTYFLLPTEIEALYRSAGDSVTAGQLSQAMSRLRASTESLEGWKWYYEPCYVNLYLVSGQFFKGILVGQNALEHSKEHEREKAEVLGIVSRCYEMVGAFDEAAEWKTRQISASDMKDYNNLVLYKDLARVRLKQGAFTKAAEAFYKYIGKHTTREAESTLAQLIIAQLYLLGEDRGRYMEMIAILVDEYRAKGELSSLATILQEEGFPEEAAKIYDELGGKAHQTAPGDIVQGRESDIESEAERQDKNGVLLCSCGAALQPHWKLCPSCGKSVEMVCSCGELLKAGWKLCPACGKKITA